MSTHSRRTRSRVLAVVSCARIPRGIAVAVNCDDTGGEWEVVPTQTNIRPIGVPLPLSG